MKHSQWFRKGLRSGVPIALGYFAVSFALGITAKTAGMNALQSGVMSFTMLASAGEFAAINLIAAGAGVFEMIFTTLIVNLRYLLMSAALSQKLDEKTPLLHRFLLSYCVTDEIFAVSVSVDGKLDPYYTYGIALISSFGWTLGTVLGVVLGTILPAPIVSALSVALYGMFLAVIIPASKKNFFVGILVLVSMAASWIFSVLPMLRSISSGFKVIILTIVIAGIAAFIRPVADNEGGENE